MTFSILSVCTGNICRSPVAALLLAEALKSLSGVKIESAGTGAMVGGSVPSQALRLAATRGVDASEHVARQVEIDMIRSADLILVMARDHRRSIVELAPTAMRRTFTLREFARIGDAIAPQLREAVSGAGATTAEDGMRAAVSLAAAMRGTITPPAEADEFDIVDPYRRSDRTYELSFEQLAPAADAAATFLTSAARLASQC